MQISFDMRTNRRRHKAMKTTLYHLRIFTYTHKLVLSFPIGLYSQLLEPCEIRIGKQTKAGCKSVLGIKLFHSLLIFVCISIHFIQNEKNDAL